MKKCYKCEEVKDLNHYYTDRTRKDGLTNQCKSCKYKYDKEYSKKRKKYFKKYYKENAQVYVDYNERRRERHSLEPRIRMNDGARRRALKKGLEYNLKSYKDLPEVPVFCPILGIPLVSNRGSKNGGSDNSPSLDRINNDRGYIIGNLQIISRKANQMKSNGSFEDIKKLYLFMKQQQIKQK